MTTDDTLNIVRPPVMQASSPASPPAAGQGAAPAGAARRRTLGKGLGALLGEAAEDYSQLNTPRAAPGAPGNGLTKVGLASLYACFYQPRRTFTPENLKELADSIREKGILQPILVRPHPSRPGSYEIIAGERRWRAAQMVGLNEVPAIIREMTDAQVAEAALIENIQREDLSILEEAKAYERLIKTFGHRQEDVARLVGKSRAYIANAIRLLKLPDSIQEKINEGLLSASHARAMLSAEGDPLIYEQLLARGKKLSVRETEAAMQEMRGQDYRPAKGKLRDANTVALEKMLADTLGLKVSITGRGSKGTLMIRYQTLEQLDDILKKLCGGQVTV